MSDKSWTKIDLRKGEKTLPPAHKKVLLYINGEYQTGIIGGLTPLSTFLHQLFHTINFLCGMRRTTSIHLNVPL